MVMDKMVRADCFLIPIIQAIKVAGSYYKGFEIPTEFTFLWKYLSQVYKTKTFVEPCPSDRETIMHYEKKTVKTAAMSIKITLMKDTYIFYSIYRHPEWRKCARRCISHTTCTS